MFALHVRHELLPDALADFDRLVEQTVTEIRRHEPGTLVYAVGVPQEDPTARVFLEIYRDLDAFERHSAQPHVLRFLAARQPMLTALTVETMPDCAGVLPAPRGRPSAAVG